MSLSFWHVLSLKTNRIFGRNENAKPSFLQISIRFPSAWYLNNFHSQVDQHSALIPSSGTFKLIITIQYGEKEGKVEAYDAQGQV